MTFKKSNKRAQAILEYFILTTIVLTVILFFTVSPYFTGIRNSCENAVNDAIDVMLTDSGTSGSSGTSGTSGSAGTGTAGGGSSGGGGASGSWSRGG